MPLSIALYNPLLRLQEKINEPYNSAYSQCGHLHYSCGHYGSVCSMSMQVGVHVCGVIKDIASACQVRPKTKVQSRIRSRFYRDHLNPTSGLANLCSNLCLV